MKVIVWLSLFAILSLTLIAAGILAILSDNNVSIQENPLLIAAALTVCVLTVRFIISMVREARDLYAWHSIKRLERVRTTMPKATLVRTKR